MRRTCGVFQPGKFRPSFWVSRQCFVIWTLKEFQKPGSRKKSGESSPQEKEDLNFERYSQRIKYWGYWGRKWKNNGCSYLPFTLFQYVYIYLHTYIESLESNVNMASVRDDWEKKTRVSKLSVVLSFLRAIHSGPWEDPWSAEGFSRRQSQSHNPTYNMYILP